MRNVKSRHFFYVQISSNINKLNKICFKLAHICLLVLLSGMILNFIYQLNINQQQYEKFEQFQNNYANIKAIAQIDWQRRYNIKKILTIIDQYDTKMKAELKLRIAEEIHEMSFKYTNLDVELICATITHETARTWDANIVSPANACGLMQILPITGTFLAAEEGIKYNKIEDILFDPIVNIRLGCRYLSSLIRIYHVDGGLAAYNGGQKRAEMWVRNGRAEGILFRETAFYVPSVLKIYEEYRQMSI